METTRWKFRGFDAVGDKCWVYGDLVHNKKVTETGLEDRVMVGGYEVVPESIGLCLNFKDKKGVTVYEGDIIKDHIDFIGYVRYDNAQLRFEYGQMYEDGLVSSWSWLDIRSEYEVIGNIFENPDMVRIKET